MKSSQVDTWYVIHRFSDRGSTPFVSCHRVKKETSLVRIRDSDLLHSNSLRDFDLDLYEETYVCHLSRGS